MKFFIDKISKEEVKNVLKVLNEWKVNEVIFVMFKVLYDFFYYIRWFLNKMVEEKLFYSDERIS